MGKPKMQKRILIEVQNGAVARIRANTSVADIQIVVIDWDAIDESTMIPKSVVEDKTLLYDPAGMGWYVNAALYPFESEGNVQSEAISAREMMQEVADGTGGEVGDLDPGR